MTCLYLKPPLYEPTSKTKEEVTPVVQYKIPDRLPFGSGRSR